MLPPLAGLDGGLEPDVGEVGHRQNIHDAPGLVVDLSPCFMRPMDSRTVLWAPSQPTTYFASTVTSVCWSPSPRRIVARTGSSSVLGGLERDEFVVVVDVQAARGVPCVFQQEVRQSGLVDDDVREFGQSVADVLHAPEALDARRVPGIGPPEVGLVDPVGFCGHPLGQAEGLERLDGLAVHTVGPADLQRAGCLLHHAGQDARELGQLSGEEQSGRPGTDNEDIDLVRQIGLIVGSALGRGSDPRVAFSITVEEVLHCASFILPCTSIASWGRPPASGLCHALACGGRGLDRCGLQVVRAAGRHEQREDHAQQGDSRPGCRRSS